MEKKTYKRPTWALVRRLEAEIAELKADRHNIESACDDLVALSLENGLKLDEQIDGTSVIVKDCNAWRDKYRELKEKFDAIMESRAVTEDYVPAEDYRKVSDALHQTEQSNKLMEKELDRLRGEMAMLERKNDALSQEIYELETRGLLSRIFNRRK